MPATQIPNRSLAAPELFIVPINHAPWMPQSLLILHFLVTEDASFCIGVPAFLSVAELLSVTLSMLLVKDNSLCRIIIFQLRKHSCLHSQSIDFSTISFLLSSRTVICWHFVLELLSEDLFDFLEELLVLM
jgi:hypothetical protein